MPFLTKYEYKILFDFQKSPNTEYRIIFGIENIRIPNTEYYLVSRKSEYRIQKILLCLSMQIQEILFWKYVKLFGQVFGPTICIPEYYSGCQKAPILNNEYYSVLRKAEYRIQILLFRPTIRIVFEYRIIRHTLSQWLLYKQRCSLLSHWFSDPFPPLDLRHCKSHSVGDGASS